MANTSAIVIKNAQHLYKLARDVGKSSDAAHREGDSAQMRLYTGALLAGRLDNETIKIGGEEDVAYVTAANYLHARSKSDVKFETWLKKANARSISTTASNIRGVMKVGRLEGCDVKMILSFVPVAQAKLNESDKYQSGVASSNAMLALCSMVRRANDALDESDLHSAAHSSRRKEIADNIKGGGLNTANTTKKNKMNVAIAAVKRVTNIKISTAPKALRDRIKKLIYDAQKIVDAASGE